MACRVINTDDVRGCAALSARSCKFMVVAILNLEQVLCILAVTVLWLEDTVRQTFFFDCWALVSLVAVRNHGFIAYLDA